MYCYTGVGSRNAPDEILARMTALASRLEDMGYTLRSGGAEGADQAFEAGVKNAAFKEIYLAKDATSAAEAIARDFHPNWDACSSYARALHSRNVFQVLGLDLKTPSQFVICWTRNGLQIGGTRTAIVVAEANRIPVFNLGKKDELARLDAFIVNLPPVKSTPK